MANTANPWAPVEPPSILWLEHANFAGNTLAQIAYGIVIILFFRCLYSLLHPNYRKSENGNYNWTLIVYTSLLFSLGTVFVGMNMQVNLTSYIDHREFPGGPIAYSFFLYSKPLVIIPNACFIISNWLADGLLMYRCYIIYRKHILILVAPAILHLGSISMGVITLYKSSEPQSSLWSDVTVNFGLPYFSISCANNVFLTLLITGRLLFERSRLRRLSPDGQLYTPYFSITAMLVESCALYAIFSILFIGTYASNNYASDIFLPLLSQTQIIAPILLIVRVAEKRAWTDETASQTVGAMSALKFNHRQSRRASDILGDANNLDISTIVADLEDVTNVSGREGKVLSHEQSFSSLGGVRKFVEWEIV